NLERAGFSGNPLEDGSLDAFQTFSVDITGMTLKAVAEIGLNKRAASRCKNFFALGLVYWMFNRSIDHTVTWLEGKFRAKAPDVADANVAALKAGYYFGETAEVFTHSYHVKPAAIEPGRYRNISGNEAAGLGFIAAAELAGLDLYLGSYPITPASDLLHFLSRQKHLGVKTFQAEDEIAAVCAAIGAAYAGQLALTSSSGPGVALKGEGLGLAHILELPLILADMQRGGPSTGLPTKTEQSDLMMAIFGRNGEAPLPVVAARSPGDCFYTAIEAARIALTYMTPVIFLSDGYLANGTEPWRIRTEVEGFQPYSRDENLARPWALPGTPHLEHRIGGLEKQHLTGNVSYDPDNHEFMCKLRTEKVQKVADSLPPTELHGAHTGDVLVLSWGGTFGSVRAAVDALIADGHDRLGHVHLRHLNPFPNDLGDIFSRFEKVLVPELNLGQLSYLVRAKYLVEAVPFHKMKGKPFKEAEVANAIIALEETLR
ncbi:MAG: 2-oxoacid:acceptor oxidoreductase subunit alpha, partial [Planctomycetota bacterium]